MKIKGAVIKEMGQKFAIVMVKKYILDSSSESEKVMNSFMFLFPNLPLVLMAQDSKGTVSYYGCQKIINFLESLYISPISWKEYMCS